MFWVKTRFVPSGCWEWTASKYQNGYGQFHLPGGKGIRAHRAAWTLAYGPIPDGLVVMHRCDNRSCVRPDHLALGTQSENIRDMYAKRRGPAPRPRGPQEFCRKGHSEWYVRPDGKRTCKPCRRTRFSAWAKKRRANARQDGAEGFRKLIGG